VLKLAADEFRRQMDVNVIRSIIGTQGFGPLRNFSASSLRCSKYCASWFELTC
jgi:hypothetical protein